MFIKLHFYNDGDEVRVNVNSILYYYSENCNSIRILFKDGRALLVTESPEEIDTLIEEAVEQRVTNIDNLLGISCMNYQYSRT